MFKRIGIQIITRDRQSYLAALLTSLLRQTKKEWDLFLVDNSTNPISNDHLCSSLLTRINWEGHRIIYKHMPDTRDTGVLRNAAMDMCDCEFGCRIDDDSICEPDYLEKLYDLINLTDSIAAVGGLVPVLSNEKIYREPPEKMNAITEFFDLDGEADQCYFYNTDIPIESDDIRSSFIFRNEIGKKIRCAECYGKTGYREETDFVHRMKIMGHQLFIVPDAVCWHVMAPVGGTRDETKDMRTKNITKFKRRMKEWSDQYQKKNRTK